MKELSRIQVGFDPVQNFFDFAVHPSEPIVAVANNDGFLRVYRMTDQSTIWEFDFLPTPDERTSMSAICFSDDGSKLLGAVNSNETLYLLDAMSGVLLHQIEIPDSSMVGADFHAIHLCKAEKHLVVNNCGATACLRLDDASLVWKDGFPDECCSESLAITNEGEVVYENSGGEIVIRDLEGGKIRLRFTTGGRGFCVHPNGSEILSWSGLLGFTRYSVSDGRKLRTIPYRSLTQNHIFEWLPEHSRILLLEHSGKCEKLVALDTRTGQVVDEFEFHRDLESWSVQASPNHNKAVLVSGDDGFIRVIEFG